MYIYKVCGIWLWAGQGEVKNFLIRSTHPPIQYVQGALSPGKAARA
jgi:hypothetical protein